MKIHLRRIVNIFGLLVFIIILALSIYNKPAAIENIKWHFLVIAGIALTLSTATQVIQTRIFLKNEEINSTWHWCIWFTAEKSWINTALPFKAGTIGAVVVLKTMFDLPWEKYAYFMICCSAITLSTSLLGAALFFLELQAVFAIAVLLYVLFNIALCHIMLKSLNAGLMLTVLAITNLAAVTIGIGACLLGIDSNIPLVDLTTVGITLNILSIASITPGNLGFRETVLVVISPLMNTDFPKIIIASACYIFLRLLINLAVAMASRPTLLKQSASKMRPK